MKTMYEMMDVESIKKEVIKLKKDDYVIICHESKKELIDDLNKPYMMITRFDDKFIFAINTLDYSKKTVNTMNNYSRTIANENNITTYISKFLTNLNYVVKFQLERFYQVKKVALKKEKENGKKMLLSDYKFINTAKKDKYPFDKYITFDLSEVTIKDIKFDISEIIVGQAITIYQNSKKSLNDTFKNHINIIKMNNLGLLVEYNYCTSLNKIISKKEMIDNIEEVYKILDAFISKISINNKNYAKEYLYSNSTKNYYPFEEGYPILNLTEVTEEQLYDNITDISSRQILSIYHNTKKLLDDNKEDSLIMIGLNIGAILVLHNIPNTHYLGSGKPSYTWKTVHYVLSKENAKSLLRAFLSKLIVQDKSIMEIENKKMYNYFNSDFNQYPFDKNVIIEIMEAEFNSMQKVNDSRTARVICKNYYFEDAILDFYFENKIEVETLLKERKSKKDEETKIKVEKIKKRKLLNKQFEDDEEFDEED